MPKVRPISPVEARGSLAHRLSRRADRVRQIATRLGVRPYRCFLTWTRSGLLPDSERGEGHERVLLRAEILPTPRVQDLTAIAARQWLIGNVPEGSLRVDRISAYAYGEDVLRGLKLPDVALPNAQPIPGRTRAGEEREFAGSVDFFWEIVEDGRGDDPASRKRMRVFGGPYRDAGGVQWVVLLERASKDTGRDGRPEELDALGLPR